MDELNRQINLNPVEAAREEGPIDKDGTEDIWQAVLKGSLAGVKYHFAQNPSTLNKKHGYEDFTVLHLASIKGHFEIAKYLLSKLAQVDAPNKFNKTPLMYACLHCHISIVNLLLDKGADINHLDINRETPLYDAVKGKHLEIVKLLIDRGADRTIKK